ncbi:MAG: SUMF1/EgtB/PvdO family nonheme iron enzyme, partial [Dehalococcoidia bacterium]
THEYGIEFVTVGNVNNPATLIPRPGTIGETMPAGSVNYEYRIGRLEITTGQWLAFVNTFSTQSDDLSFFAEPNFWGAGFDPEYDGPGIRWRLANVPNAEMRPVYGISWREAAMYCNWLCNDQSSSLDALTHGAYDTSTFGRLPTLEFTDQATHSPGARFWIPTLDEWIKAVYYDPDHSGPGIGGWWQYPNSSNAPLLAGPPGFGQTNSGFTLPDFGHLDIPLASYPTVTTPYGLLDASGANSEWNEFIFSPGFHEQRALMGARTGQQGYEPEWDQLGTILASLRPDNSTGGGFRVAAAVPAASPSGLCVLGSLIGLWRRPLRKEQST